VISRPGSSSSARKRGLAAKGFRRQGFLGVIEGSGNVSFCFNYTIERSENSILVVKSEINDSMAALPEGILDGYGR
jgi:hypothetical protein